MRDTQTLWHSDTSTQQRLKRTPHRYFNTIINTSVLSSTQSHQHSNTNAVAITVVITVINAVSSTVTPVINTESTQSSMRILISNFVGGAWGCLGVPGRAWACPGVPGLGAPEGAWARVVAAFMSCQLCFGIDFGCWIKRRNWSFQTWYSLACWYWEWSYCLKSRPCFPSHFHSRQVCRENHKKINYNHKLFGFQIAEVVNIPLLVYSPDKRKKKAILQLFSFHCQSRGFSHVLWLCKSPRQRGKR